MIVQPILLAAAVLAAPVTGPATGPAPAPASAPAPGPAPAAGAPAPAPAKDPAQIKRRLAEVQSRMSAVDQQLEALKKRRRGVLVELQGIQLTAERMRGQAETVRLRRDQARAEVSAISAQKEKIQQEIAARRVELRRQARWMQVRGPLDGLDFLSGLSSFEDFLVQGRFRTYLRDQERTRLDRIQLLQADLVRREHDLQAAMERLAADEQAAKHAEEGLQLHEVRLQSFLDGLKADEARQKEVQAELAEEAVQLDRMLSQLVGKPRGEAFEPATGFATLRGELPQPTPGTLAQTFGEHLHPMFRTRTLQSGLLIAGEQGAPVEAVADGRVVFADLYQSFGPMVILDHGGGYFTLYTHLESLAAARGQVLKQGEALGYVGGTIDGPRLGFEIRYQTQPQDPNRWLKVKYR